MKTHLWKYIILQTVLIYIYADYYIHLHCVYTELNFINDSKYHSYPIFLKEENQIKYFP